MARVNSKLASYVGFDGKNKVLVVIFHSGRKRRFSKFSDKEYEELIKLPQPESFDNALVKVIEDRKNNASEIEKAKRPDASSSP